MNSELVIQVFAGVWKMARRLFSNNEFRRFRQRYSSKTLLLYGLFLKLNT